MFSEIETWNCKKIWQRLDMILEVWYFFFERAQTPYGQHRIIVIGKIKSLFLRLGWPQPYHYYFSLFFRVPPPIPPPEERHLAGAADFFEKAISAPNEKHQSCPNFHNFHNELEVDDFTYKDTFSPKWGKTFFVLMPSVCLSHILI